MARADAAKGNVAARKGEGLPPEVFREFRTREFSTLARGGTPITNSLDATMSRTATKMWSTPITSTGTPRAPSSAR